MMATDPASATTGIKPLRTFSFGGGWQSTAAEKHQQAAPWLDWRDRAHWGGRLLPCVLCGRGAFCRDDAGRPCHKTCAESALAHQASADHDLLRGDAA